MTTTSEIDYLRRRAAAERDRAERCDRDAARSVHLQLAALYDERAAAMLAANRPKLQLV